MLPGREWVPGGTGCRWPGRATRGPLVSWQEREGGKEGGGRGWEGRERGDEEEGDVLAMEVMGGLVLGSWEAD